MNISKQELRKSNDAAIALYLENNEITIIPAQRLPKSSRRPIIGSKYSTFQKGAKRVSLNLN
jgi:hypothetical protein